MTTKKKNIIRKIIYALLFSLCIAGFIILGNKYAQNPEDKVVVFSDYYPDINNDFEVIRGTELINKLSRNKNLIFIGSSSSKWSQKYAELINEISNESNVDKIYYYDLSNDKVQKNSNYYEIREKLKGYLTTTDGSDNNLLAPSFYIVDNGKVKYYNTDTTSMQNALEVSDYWTFEKEVTFKMEIKEAIIKYYLN